MGEFDNNSFDALRISLASADKIREWSHGEVKKPETINYRTLKPEKDGLFCERIFGPVNDYECSCGKYKGIRFKGIVCERCGVEVTTSKVRRERMGHIELAAPMSHIWYLKSPNLFPLPRLLDLKGKELEDILYYASYIVTDVNADAREEDAADLKEELDADLEELDAERDEEIERLQQRANPPEGEVSTEKPLTAKQLAAEIADITDEYEGDKQLRREAFDTFMSLKPKQLIGDEQLFTEMKHYYGIYFKGGMGAEAVRELIEQIDLPAESERLRAEIADESTSKQTRERDVKRLEIVDAFIKGGNDPKDMILDVIPVMPPDLRPMVQLDGGRFAASDLNELYRRVINRNTRLKKMLELDAPDIIVNSEKRMLQEAIDALFDNGRRGRAVTGRGGRTLKSLAESLKGKQGRFRQNLLGKRVDYSGRSVIVTDPKLKMDQCGIPYEMALELFKPFVMNRLIEHGMVANVREARRAIEHQLDFVWDALDEAVVGKVVLLNRAPTLHRLSIQAFEPVLVEGKAIHLHPLVCAPFNADFDGDQMSVHLPLSDKAQQEARMLMLSTHNLRKPASGDVITIPSQDMILGAYFLTSDVDGGDAEPRIFDGFADVLRSYEARMIPLRDEVLVRVGADGATAYTDDDRALFVVRDADGERTFDVTDRPVRIRTTVGRVIFNEKCLPDDYPYINRKMVKSDIARLVSDCCERYGNDKSVRILDAIKHNGFHYATRAGISISVWDAIIPDEKEGLLAEAQDKVDGINRSYENGMLTEAERHAEVIHAWTECTDAVGADMLGGFAPDNPIFMMADSGARGSKTQLRQLAGMRGLMADMSGDTIDLPIKSNFREGLEPLEYFISTYGARKGLVDTASHTADSGYLTRRLVDVAQDVIVREEDCGTDEALHYPVVKPGADDVDTELIGRCALHDITLPDGTVVVPAGGYVERKEQLERLRDAGVREIELRGMLTCKCHHGVCQKCYGWDLSKHSPVEVGTAVGVIAAQSIGEPGTQLTMRTIHSGGVAGADDITQGLPTVARMFDVVSNVNEKILGRAAELAEAGGVLSIRSEQSEYMLQIADPETGEVLEQRRVPASVKFMPGIEDGATVRTGDQLTSGFIDFHHLRELADIESTMHTFVNAVKEVYMSQGVDLNDKHIEVIARQMLRRVEVTDPGDSDYIMGAYVDRYEFADKCAELVAQGKDAPTARPVIMGTHKAASSIDSWLSSASFIRTAGVLTKSAIEGDVDHLLDLKSNVIVGKKIPAGTGLGDYGGVVFEKEVAPRKSVDDVNWVEDYSEGDVDAGGGMRISSRDANMYLGDDLGLSTRWANKFMGAGIKCVRDLVGKTESDLLDVEGIGYKAVEELRDRLDERGLGYVIVDTADNDELGKLSGALFSPGGDIMLGSSDSPEPDEGELIGGGYEPASDVVNESNEDVIHMINHPE